MSSSSPTTSSSPIFPSFPISCSFSHFPSFPISCSFFMHIPSPYAEALLQPSIASIPVPLCPCPPLSLSPFVRPHPPSVRPHPPSSQASKPSFSLFSLKKIPKYLHNPKNHLTFAPAFQRKLNCKLRNWGMV